jgi:hypothetical protein
VGNDFRAYLNSYRDAVYRFCVLSLATSAATTTTTLPAAVTIVRHFGLCDYRLIRIVKLSMMCPVRWFQSEESDGRGMRNAVDRRGDQLGDLCLDWRAVLNWILVVIRPTSVLLRSEFLATDPEVPGSIPGATRLSEK